MLLTSKYLARVQQHLTANQIHHRIVWEQEIHVEDYPVLSRKIQINIIHIYQLDMILYQISFPIKTTSAKVGRMISLINSVSSLDTKIGKIFYDRSGILYFNFMQEMKSNRRISLPAAQMYISQLVPVVNLIETLLL
jgi:hypothetical protein